MFWDALVAWLVWNIVGPLCGFLLLLALLLLTCYLTRKVKP